MSSRTVSVKLRAEVSQYMANMRTAGKATSDLEKASKQLTVAFDNEEDAAGRVRVAQEKLNEAQKSGKAKASQLAVAQERLATAQRQHTRAQDESRVASERYLTVQKQISDAMQEQIRADSDDALVELDRQDRATEKVARRANVRFRAIMTGIVTGLPVASAAVIGAATAATGASFVALGAVALRNNIAIRRSFEDLSETVQSDLASDAAVMEDAFVGAAHRLGTAYQGLRPQLRQAFAESVPHVNALTDGVIEFAEGAMPGMVTSVRNAGPAVDGLRIMLGDLGTDIGDFLGSISEYSDEAGQGLEHLGSLVGGTLTGLGPILGDLTTLWAEHGDQVADVVTRIIGVIGGLTGSSLPVFSTALGVALDVLDGLLNVLEPLSGALGPMIGTWLSLAAAIKTIGAVRGVLGNVSTTMTDFGKSMSKAESRARSFRMAGGALALALATVMSSMNDLNPQVDALDEGLGRWVSTGRATGEAARVLGSDLGELNYAIDAVNSGGFEKAITGVAEAVTGLVGYAPFEEAQEQIRALDSSLAGMVSSGNGDQAAAIIERIAKQTGKSIADVKAALPEYTAAIEQAAEQQRKLGTTALQSMPGIDALEESLLTLSDQTADTADKAAALNDAWRRLFGVALSLEEAQAAFEGGLDDIAESMKGVQEESSNWEAQLLNANGTVNLTTEAGRTLSEQLITQGEDYRTLAQTAYDSALQQGQSQQEATRAAVAATTERRNQFIREMTQILGNEGAARKLADRYLGMPKNVMTFITAPGMASAIAHAQRLAAWYDSIPRSVRTVVETVAIGPFNAMMGAARFVGSRRDGGLVPGYANGGLPQFPAGGLFRGAGGPRDDANLVAISDGEYITNARDTARNLAALEAGNRGATLVAVGGPTQGMASGGVVRGISMREAIRMAPSLARPSLINNISVSFPNYVGNRAELDRHIRQTVAKVGGGDVQKTYGRR